MWKQALLALAKKLFELWLSQQVAPKFGVASPVMTAAPGDCTDDFQKLIAAVEQDQPKAGVVGVPGGLLQHLKDAYAAYQTGNYLQALTIIMDAIKHVYEIL